FFLCSCLSSSYILAHLLLMFLLVFFLCSHSSSSYVLAYLFFTFSLIFFLYSYLSSSYILSCLLLIFFLVISSFLLIMNICCRLYILLNQISRCIIKQSEKVFLKVIFRSFLADSFFAELMCVVIFLTKIMHHQAV